MATARNGQPTEEQETRTNATPTASVPGSNEARIIDACERRDVDELRDIAITPGGFLSDHLRSRAWPILLGCDASTASNGSAESPESSSWRQLPRHRDEDQVKLDVDRSFVYYPNYPTQAELESKKSELSDLITQVLRTHPYLCYFQGYHDIFQVLLLALPPGPRRSASAARLSVLRIRDFMLPTLAPAIAQLRLIPDLLAAADPALWARLFPSRGRVGIGGVGGGRGEAPFFALADTLTMFAHNVRAYGDIARLFDALLAREQAFSLYVFAQIVLSRRHELLSLTRDDDDDDDDDDNGGGEPDMDMDMDMLHFTLSKLPQDLDLDAVVAAAAALLARHPPESLPSWRRVSPASALKTARDPRALARMSLADGRALFERQVRELRWDERRQQVVRVVWANRRVLLAVVVGLGAVYLRRSPVWATLVAWTIRLGGGGG